MVHQDYKELLAAKALTALDAEDARALDTHLQGCAACRFEMVEWAQTAAFLAIDADRHEPSQELRQRILASVSAAVGNDGLNENRASDLSGPVTSSAEAKILAFERPRRNVSSWGSVGAVAAALALVALLASLIVLWQQNQKIQTELAQLSTQMEQAKAQLAREREAVELLTSPGARMASLAGTNEAPAAHAMIAYDKKGQAMLMAKGLPAAPKGMAYQLWYIVGSKPMPGKVFITDESGNGVLKDQVPEIAMGSAVFAITLEPESGVQAPTGKMYLTSG